MTSTRHVKSAGGSNARPGRVIAAIGLLMWVVAGTASAAGPPAIDPSYVDGQTYYMIGARMMLNVAQTNPKLYAQAEELYLLVYPLNPSGTDTDSKTLPSGYKPQCDPCYHPGLPGVFAYHDHVLTGGPGLGTAGTAGNNKGPWKIIVLVYNPAMMDSQFNPVTSASDIPAAEAAGKFLPINGSGTGDPFEIDTGNVLICPLVSPSA